MTHAVAELKEKQRIAYRKFTLKIENAREERRQARLQKHQKYMVKALEA